MLCSRRLPPHPALLPAGEKELIYNRKLKFQKGVWIIYVFFGRSLFFYHSIVEGYVFVRCFSGAHFKGFARVKVKLAGNHVRYGKSPLDFLAKRNEILLYAAKHRAQIILGVFKEPNQQFHRAIARAAPKAG